MPSDSFPSSSTAPGARAGAARRPALLEQLLHSDELTYRAGQAVAVIHAHRQRGHWLRLLLLPGATPEVAALLGERLQRPGASVGLGSSLGHAQHLLGRCGAPLGTDPAPLHALVAAGGVLEVIPGSLEAQVAAFTQTLAGALDAQVRAAQPVAARGLFSFRRSRGPDPDVSVRAEQDVQEALRALRGALGDFQAVPLRGAALDWDDVPLP
ncbi:hypothetical protein CBQ26_14585 [Deinococcus indicus]|uniref:Uncharacterized protein n=1 Tax=Deinococcus indicus TaxID=223556 RepID=A0A246BHL7_9DEIO|nr:hypothetical protein [Deinococcus indicus]OWL94743.1 hypothetical protein CBQ26_14585 [Deinococcus indicus]